MSIRQLPQDVVDKLKSGVVITSLHHVAAGLLKNSLDAGATKVNITVDFARGNCTVEDNGSGIEPDEFREEGGIGKLHHTSKSLASPSLHGKQGSFLAALATLSLLSISSRHHRYVSHNSILFHNSATLSRHVPAPVEQHLRAFDHGTRVVVRDLFGSIPVRVKQRAVLMSERFYIDKEWAQLSMHVVALLLAWPSDVVVSLRESSSQRQAALRSHDPSDIPARTSRLLKQASLADPSQADDWVPLTASTDKVSVAGCISSNPVASRRAQFISIGIQPLTNDHGTNIVYEEVNKVFNNSSFGMFEDGPDVQTKDLPDRGLKGRKGVERWPMFYFQVQFCDFAQRTVDNIMDDRNGELAAIADLLRAVCYGFLKKRQHRPGKVRMSTENPGFSKSKVLGRAKVTPLKRTFSATESRPANPPAGVRDRATRSESPFDSWQRVKVGRASKPARKSTVLGSQAAGNSSVSEKERLVGKGGVLLRDPFDDGDGDGLTLTSSHFGSSIPNSSTTSVSVRSPPRDAHKANLEKRPKVEPSEWLKRISQKWINPVFENVPLAVPRAYKDLPAPVADPRPSSRSNYFADVTGDCGVMFESNSISMDGRISKAALAQAEVVSQVDRKFILAKLPLNTPGESTQGWDSMALVMLDQHAVDERCQLEDLMAGYFVLQPDGTLSAEVECLDRPLKYEVRQSDADLLAALQEHFATWGIRFDIDVQRISRNETKNTVTISHLPPSIAQRCLSEPPLLINLLRTEAHALARPPLAPTPSDEQQAWVSYFHDCPRGILELLHSRSCRSAIMFNDVLSTEQCERLVQRLSRCVFPFQCAHGRPSMAPVLDLGVDRRPGRSHGEQVPWKTWTH